ncbi:MAG TPA: alpha/beta hydrolase-fold protein [Polyangia bacterium]
MTQWFSRPALVACAIAFGSLGCAGIVNEPNSPSVSGGGGASAGGSFTPPATGAGGSVGPGSTGGTSGSGSGGSASGTGGSVVAQGGAGGANAGAGGANGGASDGGTGMVPESASVDPGSEGDGIRQIGPGFRAAPETMMNASVPQGRVINFTIPAGSSKIYPRAPGRRVDVYVPTQYKMGTPAPVMVAQDRQFYGFTGLLQNTLNNLIAANKVPVMIAVIADNGGGDAVGSERGLEYDTVSGLYATFVNDELLPAVEAATQAQLPMQAVTFTKDPEGRGALGGSSSGAAAFSMVWWRPDLFRKALMYSATLVNQVPRDSPFPHGAWVYHDVDPYDAAKPNGLVVQHCEAMEPKYSGMVQPCDTPLSKTACEAVTGCRWNTKDNKPIRVWHASGTNDLGAGQGPGSYRNFHLGNQRLAAALQARGYHFHYDAAMGGGHVDSGVTRQTIAEALIWLWRGYRPSGQ